MCGLWIRPDMEGGIAVTSLLEKSGEDLMYIERSGLLHIIFYNLYKYILFVRNKDI